jgi:hypothetical protein
MMGKEKGEEEWWGGEGRGGEGKKWREEKERRGEKRTRIPRFTFCSPVQFTPSRQADDSHFSLFISHYSFLTLHYSFLSF